MFRLTSSLLLAVFATAVTFGANPDVAAAAAHRSQYPKEEWIHHYYISYQAIPEAQRQSMANAVAFVFASTSKEPIVEYCTPQKVGKTLYHFDLRNLRWDFKRFRTILEKRNPYDGYTLVLRPDWLIVELTDTSESESQYELLYEKVPKKREEFFAELGVITKKEFRFGLIEGQSGVSKVRQRWIESFVLPRGYAWGTRDVLKIEEGKDPLEAPDGKFKHDGEEHIIGIPKVSLTTGQRGNLQVYFLSDGQGNRVDKADPDLVEDTSEFRGRRAIRNSGSCIQCHSAGLNAPSENLLRSLLLKGVRLTTKRKRLAKEIELFHLTDVGKAIERANEDFATGLKITNGLTPDENLKAFRSAIAFYDAPVTLDQAAAELYTTPEELKNALGLKNKVGARLALLAEGVPMPRTVWEQKYSWSWSYMKEWRGTQ